MQLNISYLPRRFFGLVDKLTDNFTSYRLVYWLLIAYLLWAALASFIGIGHLAIKWYDIVASTVWLIAVCQAANWLLSTFLNIARNKESGLITALILSLIFTPASRPHDFIVLAGAGLIAITSKYLLTIRRAHLFNPAATGAFLMGLVFHKYASWWVGTAVLTPVVLAGGILILRKMKRFSLVLLFLATYLLLVLLHTWNGSFSHSWHQIWLNLAETQLLFFAFVMLTEPMTSPTTEDRYLPYALLVAIAYGSLYWRIGSWQPTFSPEQALLIGNLLAAVVAFSPRYKLKLLRRVNEAEGISSFVYSIPKNFKFKAGQYMEWTLPASKSDNRGNRRYLTIASAPTEKYLMITVRLPETKSFYKSELDKSPAGSLMLSSRLAGSFVLPKNRQQKVAFLAGGVGITPFRSMIKYMLDSGDIRDSTLFYSVNTPKEVAFKDVLVDAKKHGIRPYVVVTEPPPHWSGLSGRLDDKAIKRLLPDYQERLFYVSGPLPFVSAMEAVLTSIGVANSKIKTDYFPGYT